MFACMYERQLRQSKFYTCLVFDRYDFEISINQAERDRRTQIERQLLHYVQTNEHYLNKNRH